jgi:hypothetical protein
MTAPIFWREQRLKEIGDVWNSKLTAEELDMYKPRIETVASWVMEVEKQMGTLRFGRPRWGAMCAKG